MFKGGRLGGASKSLLAVIDALALSSSAWWHLLHSLTRVCPPSPVSQCRVHDSGDAGIMVVGEGVAGVYEGNDVFRNRSSGLFVLNGARPSVRDNMLRENAHGLSILHARTRGRFVNNDVLSSSEAGVQISEGACPTLIGNRIRLGRLVGVGISQGGSNPTLLRNEVSDNAGTAVLILEGARPTLKGNTLARGPRCGVLVSGEGSLPRIEGNSITDFLEVGAAWPCPACLPVRPPPTCPL